MGSTDEEVHSQLPGDEVVPDPTFAATQSHHGQCASGERLALDRANGLRSRRSGIRYDLLDNSGPPQLRTSHRDPFKKFRSATPYPWDPAGGGPRVKGLEPDQWLLWWDGLATSTWAWRLGSAGPGRTRLLTRVRIHYRWTHPTILFNLLLVEPWDFPDDAEMHRSASRSVLNPATFIGA